eukprot:543168-Alexandrium_andersonii.AAC.1
MALAAAGRGNLRLLLAALPSADDPAPLVAHVVVAAISRLREPRSELPSLGQPSDCVEPADSLLHPDLEEWPAGALARAHFSALSAARGRPMGTNALSRVVWLMSSTIPERAPLPCPPFGNAGRPDSKRQRTLSGPARRRSGRVSALPP